MIEQLGQFAVTDFDIFQLFGQSSLRTFDDAFLLQQVVRLFVGRLLSSIEHPFAFPELIANPIHFGFQLALLPNRALLDLELGFLRTVGDLLLSLLDDGRLRRPHRDREAGRATSRPAHRRWRPAES